VFFKVFFALNRKVERESASGYEAVMLLAETDLPFLSTNPRFDFNSHSRFRLSTLNNLSRL
jgi:hypothetical protein